MANTDSPLSFAISYGFVGGKLHSRGLLKRMHEAGFQATSLKQADVIIAHSAGCWLIPKQAKPKLIVYIGMPLATDKPQETWRKAVKSGYTNNSLKRSLKVTSKNVFYGLKQPGRNLNIITSASKSAPVIFEGVPGIFITNRHDPWPQAARLDEFTRTRPWSFINLTGSHDDIWDHPDRYVDIIKHYAALLD
jgi:hypothetical protein